MGRLDAYVLANGKDMSSAKIDEFKSRQGGVGVPLQRLCSGDGVELYNAFEKRRPRAPRDDRQRRRTPWASDLGNLPISENGAAPVDSAVCIPDRDRRYSS